MQKIPTPTTVDFETHAIRDPMSRPRHPPAPIGVSVKDFGKPSVYYAFAHLRGNTHTYAEARAALMRAWANPDGILCHNGKFDYDVAVTHMGMPELPWHQIHDTMFLLFLDDPQSSNLGLKESAARILGMAPEEKDAVKEWFLANQPLWTPHVRAPKKKSKKPEKEAKPRRTRPKSHAGVGTWVAPGDVAAHYPYVPPAILGPYANGDTDRTEALFRRLWPSVMARGMGNAYDRERRLMPALLRSERGGVRVDLPRLRADVIRYRAVLARVTAWIAQRIGVAPDFGLDGDGFVPALVAAGLADVSKMGLTPGGKVRTNKEAITAGVADGQLAAMIQYRAQLKTCLNTFLETWLVQASLSQGFIHTSWNQVRGAGIGARTGRLSSTPNFQNIPKEFAPIFEGDVSRDKLALPEYAYLRGRACPLRDLPPLPLCRSYIIPHAPDHVLIDMDYTQQEIRILAHFEAGSLRDQYLENPWIDFHDTARAAIKEILHKDYPRRIVKNVNLGIIYGQGIASLAQKNDASYDETKDLKSAIYNLYPGLKEQYDDARAFSQEKRDALGRVVKPRQPFVTWGGREYFAEKPIVKNNKVISFDYKLVNARIQGSAADCTKEAAIRLDASITKLGKRGVWHFVLQVHDSILMSVPRADYEPAREVLRQCMESVEFSVPMLTESDWSVTNWQAVKPHDRKGSVVDSFKLSDILAPTIKRKAA